MSLTASLVPLIINFISAGGYPALLLLTFLDSTVLPVPNEAIMPFAGFLIFSGRFSFTAVIAVSIVGAILGALTSYAIGYAGAGPFVRRFGKYARVRQEDLDKTHAFFAKYGECVILISRFIPVVRQFISIPAGAAKMNVGKFILYTAIGSTMWNSLILTFGYLFGEHWTVVQNYTSWIDKGILAAFFIAAGWYLYRRTVSRGRVDFSANK